MVLRILVLLIGLTGFIQAQNLFYTDSYHTNLYEHQENIFVFNNNIFALLDDSTNTNIENVISTFFENVNVKAQRINSNNITQIKYSYSSNDFDALKWSKTWHQEFGMQLSAILNTFVKNYFEGGINVPEDIYTASILKHAYYNLKAYHQRTSDFSKTTLQISSNKVNEMAFKKVHLDPNLSLNRIVTKSFGNYYNESYPVSSLSKEKMFIFGPSNKARLKDCLSLLFYEQLNSDATVSYLKDNTILIQDSLTSVALTEDLVKLYKSTLRQNLLEDINSMDICFYNIEDKRNVTKLFAEYKLEDYEEFQNIYIHLNSYNFAKPMDQISETFNKQILESRLFFKVNDTSFVQNRESAVINSIANFLNHNTIEHLLIIGYAGKTEYEKINKTAYNKILNKYKDFPPVESSKSPDLSIFRAVVVFDLLVDKGVNPSSMSCISKVIDKEDLSDYAYVKFVKR